MSNSETSQQHGSSQRRQSHLNSIVRVPNHEHGTGGLDRQSKPSWVVTERLGRALRAPRGWDGLASLGAAPRRLWRRPFAARCAARSNRWVRIKTALSAKKKGLPFGSPFCLAERVGFEPTEDANPRRFSRPLHSTTLPPLRWAPIIPETLSQSTAPGQ